MASGTSYGDSPFCFGFKKYNLGVAGVANPSNIGWYDLMGASNQQVMSDTKLVVSNNTSASGAGTTSASGGTENRPSNYTIRIWKRTA